MHGNRRQKPNHALRIGGLCAVIVAAAVGIGIWLSGKAVTSRQLVSPAPQEVVALKMPQGPAVGGSPIPGQTGSQDSGPDKAPGTEPQQPVVDYDKLKEDKTLQTLMDKRKETYGFEKGVDLIVKPNESVKVGDEVVPMRDILDKIRLKSGEVIEKDIAEDSTEKPARQLREELASELEEVEKRYLELGKLIENLDPQADPKAKEIYLREREELEKIISSYKNYLETDRRLDEKKRLLQSLNKAEGPGAAGGVKVPGLEPGADLLPPIGGPKPPAATIAAPVEGETKALSPAASKPSAAGGLSRLPESKIQAGKNSEDPSVPPPGETAASVRTGPKRVSGPERVSGGGTGLQERHVTITELRKEIEREINALQLQRGDIEHELKILMKKEKRPEAYGIYVVQYGDNIWNVHFKFLKEYFDHRGRGLSLQSDEPDPRGRSSGVGKILKFSEKMVYIYNVRERELASDIHLIHPLSKIVVFNMGKVFELLEDVDYSDLDQIRFDGENIWLPARG